ncbi:NAD(P)-binding protein [Phlegmacium glaucopus]|nr:NAD(P)-binding protein [Phlegmacium glaucopus]
MKLVITGCNGSVGKRVVKLALEQGNTVLGIDLTQQRAGNDPPQPRIYDDHPEYTFAAADLRDFEVVLKLLDGYDAVINLAAHRNPGDYKVATHNSNVVISWNILRACAELGITRVAQASSANVITLVFSQQCHFNYFPIDEQHPCEPDEPYGLSKLICEMQADTIVRRYSSMKVASLRLHWSVPYRAIADSNRPKDLWGYVQEDSSAEAFLLAIKPNNDKWSGHETFFITAPETAVDENTMSLIRNSYPDVPIKEGKAFVGREGFFDCSKAATLLGWYHKDV